MKQLFSLILSMICIEAMVGVTHTKLCQADPMYSEYNYSGVWELDEDGEAICNFWQFLPEGENHRPTQIIGSEESKESDFYIIPPGENSEMIEYIDSSDFDGE